jgi:hypothetical protein
VHRVDLVAIAGYGAGRDTGLLLVWRLTRWNGGEVQDGRNVLHNLINEAHLGCLESLWRSDFVMRASRRGTVGTLWDASESFEMDDVVFLASHLFLSPSESGCA